MPRRTIVHHRPMPLPWQRKLFFCPDILVSVWGGLLGPRLHLLLKERYTSTLLFVNLSVFCTDGCSYGSWSCCEIFLNGVIFPINSCLIDIRASIVINPDDGQNQNLFCAFKTTTSIFRVRKVCQKDATVFVTETLVDMLKRITIK
jgi:hypothetical protein